MKIFFTILVFSYTTFYAAYAQNFTEQKEITEKVIQFFEENQTDEIFKLFDDTVKGAISEEKLSDIWNTLPLQCGSYLGSGDAIASEVQGLVVVNQLLDFENTDLDIRLAFTAEKQISGLFFVAPVKKKE